MAIMNTFVDETAEEEVVQSLVELRPWMKSKRFELIDTVDALDKFITEACEAGECAVDLETDGLNTGPDKRGRGSRVATIAGFCLSYHEDYGVYVPISHRYGKNIPLNVIIPKIKKLVSSTITIYHNFKFDGALLRNAGIIIENHKKIEDTLLAAAILMADRKSKGLKGLSKDILGQEMIELSSIVPSKSNIDFRELHPKVALHYAASDAVCTLGLWHEFKRRMISWDPNKSNGTRFLYEVEKGCQFAVMDMESHLIKVDVAHYKQCAVRLKKRLEELEDEIYADNGGQLFDMASNKQLGELLFDKLGIPYPLKEKSKTGDYFVKKEVLELIANKHSIPRKILELRSLEKLYSTYVINLLNNYDENECIKIQLNQSAADSGRFSARGGKGIAADGYSGVNIQNIPAVKKEDPWMLRKGFVAKPGYQLVAIDYSGEELRIATNLSNEPVWIKEFNEGLGDIHSITASILFGGTPVEMSRKENKGKRGVAKTANFLIVYGGGPGALAAKTGLTLNAAKQHLDNYLAGVPTLDEWMKIERIRAKKRGYSLTAFGRRRSLVDLYNSGDRGLASKADRLAVNAAVQGTGADIIKLTMFKVWKYIRDNDLADDVRPLFPVHDEIVYEMKKEKLDTLIPIFTEIMKIDEYIKGVLKWKVGLEVDAEYGDNFMVKNNFYEDLKEGISASVRLGMVGGEGGSPEENTETAKHLEKLGSQEGESPSVKPEVKIEAKEASLEKPIEESVNMPHKKEETSLEDLQGEYFNYEVQKTDAVAKSHTELIWVILQSIDGNCTGVKKRIRLTRRKEVIHTTTEAYSVEGFIALAYNYAI